MIPIFTHIFAFLAGLGIGLVAASGVNYALTLRRQLKAAQKALEARETPQQKAEDWPSPPGFHYVDVAPGKKALVPNQPGHSDTANDAPRFSGIGPSDIASRELYEREKARVDTTPKFASPSVLNPDLSDIREAAREATNGGKPN